jgi:4-hydroxy-tetrahydrodipicolinate synthase
MHTNFEGIWIPIVTPYQGNAVDCEALTRLAQDLAQRGISGFVAGATTGEGALLKEGELERIFTTLREAVPSIPIAIGLSYAATDAAVSAAAVLATLKPEALLVTTPTYVRPSQAGIQKHFEAITEAADLPVLIYNIPYRTGTTIEISTLQTLAQDPRVVGIKECGGSAERLLRLVSETSLRVLSGDDDQNFVALCLGAHGTVAASAHVFPERHVQMRALIAQGKVAEARDIAVVLQPLIRELFVEPNPAPLKALLANHGWCSASVRLPFVTATADLTQRLLTQYRTAEKRFT